MLVRSVHCKLLFLFAAAFGHGFASSCMCQSCKGLRALEFTNGVVIQVSDKEMLDGMSAVGLNGFDCEMASGATVAGIKKLLDDEIIKNDDKVIGILTGRQKEPMLPIEYHNDPENRFAVPPKS